MRVDHDKLFFYSVSSMHAHVCRSVLLLLSLLPPVQLARCNVQLPGVQGLPGPSVYGGGFAPTVDSVAQAAAEGWFAGRLLLKSCRINIYHACTLVWGWHDFVSNAS